MKKWVFLFGTVLIFHSLPARDSLQFVSATTGGACQEVEYANGYLYSGSGTTLRVFLAGQTHLPPYSCVFEYRYRSRIQDLKIRNGYLYVAANHDGISKWDISDPLHPQMVASYLPDLLREAAYDIEFSGDTLLVAYGIKVAVFKDLGTAFQKIGEFGITGGGGTGIVCGGALKDSLYAYVVCKSGGNQADGVYLYHARTFAFLSFYPQPFASPEDLVFGENQPLLHVAGGTQAMYNPFNPDGYFYSLDISDPYSPTLAFSDTIKGIPFVALADVINLVNRNDTIYVATGAGLKPGQTTFNVAYISVYDATNPSNIHPVAYLPAGLWHFDLCLNGDRAFIASEWYGVKTLNIGNLQNPVDLGDTPTGGWNTGGDRHGDLLLVANEGYGFKKYDISDPFHPLLTGENHDGTFCHILKFSADGNFIFGFYSTKAGLRVFDTATLTQIDSLATANLGNGKALLWQERLFADFKPFAGPERLNIFDVSDPSAVSLLQSVEMGVNDMALEQGRLFISNNDSILVYDVSGGQFQRITAVSPGFFNDAHTLAVYHDTLFVYISGIGANKLARYIFVPAAGTLTLDGYFSLNLEQPKPRRMAADSAALYLAYNLYGLYAYDRRTVQQIGYYRTGLDYKEYTDKFGVTGLYCRDGLIFLTEYFGQTTLLTWSGNPSAVPPNPEEFPAGSASMAYPNPFARATVIRFSNPGNAPHTLVLYNLLGQKVKIFPRVYGNQVEVKRTDLPAGLYFYRIRRGQKVVATGKLIVQ